MRGQREGGQGGRAGLLTSRWKRSVTFIWDRLGIFTSGAWWVLADRAGGKGELEPNPRLLNLPEPEFHGWDLAQFRGVCGP